MKKMSILLFLFLISCTLTEKFPRLSGEYLGQTPPGNTAELFAPGIVSTGMYTRDLSMTPDGSEIYYSVILGQYKYTAIMVTKQVDGIWTKPEVTSFSNNPNWVDIEHSISADGQQFFFMSNRPDSSAGEIEPGDPDIWVMDRQGDGWSDPRNLGAPVNSEDEEFFPSVTQDGTLYFTRQGKGNPLGIIYRSRFIDGKYTEPEELPEQVNCGRNRFNSFIAKDESYIITPVAGADDSYGGIDYYITFRNENDNWSQPLNMGPQVNSADRNEYSPFVSPDGKYMFFMSGRANASAEPEKLDAEILQSIQSSSDNGNPSIFWICTDVIDSLKNKAIF